MNYNNLTPSKSIGGNRLTLIIHKSCLIDARKVGISSQCHYVSEHMGVVLFDWTPDKKESIHMKLIKSGIKRDGCRM